MRSLLILFFAISLFASCNTLSDDLVDFTLDEQNNYVQFTIQGENSKIEFQQSEVRQNGAISFETPETQQFLRGKPIEVQSTPHKFTGLWRQDKRLITVSFEKDSIGIIFSLSADPSTDIVKWKINIAASEDEYFTGLFERTVDGSQKESWKQGITEAMNLRGQQVDMLIKPTLSLYCPFYISSKGYALFITGTWPGVYDFCKTDSNLVKIEFEGSSMRGKIYSSNNPADIVKAHSLNVGPTILPPKWAFLPWRWRDQHVNLKTYYNNTPVKSPYNSQVVEDILMMKAFDIPCGVYWIDRPWAKGKMGYENFEWDNERFPHAVEMIDWIHENDMRFLLWIAPWVVGDMKTTAEQNGYNQPMKYAPWGVDTTTAALLDFTNPKACRWWQKEGIEKMLRQGVDGFKLDRSEEIVPETNDIILSDGRTAREVRNAYPVMYVRTVNESCKKIKGNDFILIPRAAYTGSSKYSGFWGGDIGSPPEGLRAAIIALLRSAIIGYPIWGSDIGGYWQGDLNREVCARWLAFGCFNPIMEFGPTEDRAPWDMDSKPHFDTELIAIWRMYAKIHTELANYSYHHAIEAQKTGMPIARPLFLTYPNQPEAWNNWQTYLYGSDILISPIWQKEISEHQLYLPAGTNWMDAWDKSKIYEGGKYITVQTPMHKIPIFIKEGSDVDLGDLDELYRESLEIASQKPNLSQLQEDAFSEK